MHCRWGDLEFPLPFGRTMTAAEERIHEMDEKVSGWEVVASRTVSLSKRHCRLRPSGNT